MSDTTLTVTLTTQACLYCGKTSEVELDLEKVRRWQAGEHVQNVWPEMTTDEREVLITGIHGPCWDAIFAV
jgi:NOL1/NOP2/fmu family ribosome biogenesis protein